MSVATKQNKKKVFIRTFGCQMNVRDSEVICGLLRVRGYELIAEPKQAEVIILNTCSVRQHAEDRVLSHLGHLKHIKQTYPELIVGVIGCYGL